MFSNVGIIGLVIGYTIAGAFVFRAIEGGEKKPVNARVLRLRNETALKLWELSCCGLNVFSEVSRTVYRCSIFVLVFLFMSYIIDINCRHNLYHVSLRTLHYLRQVPI
jgi:hypothetical protein